MSQLYLNFYLIFQSPIIIQSQRAKSFKVSQRKKNSRGSASYGSSTLIVRPIVEREIQILQKLLHSLTVSATRLAFVIRFLALAHVDGKVFIGITPDGCGCVSVFRGELRSFPTLSLPSISSWRPIDIN